MQVEGWDQKIESRSHGVVRVHTRQSPQSLVWIEKIPLAAGGGRAEWGVKEQPLQK